MGNRWLTVFSLLLFALAPCNALQADNIALGKIAVASSSYETAPPSFAVDGDLSTFWNSGWWASPNEPAWFCVDLGAVYPVDQITLIGAYSFGVWEGYYENYQLYGGLDGVSWGDPIAQGSLIDNISMSERSNTIDVGGTEMRYVLFVGVGGDHWINLTELEVHAVPEPSTFALLGVGAFGLLACAWRRRAA